MNKKNIKKKDGLFHRIRKYLLNCTIFVVMTIWHVLSCGWVLTYDEFMDCDWEISDDLWTYSLNMFIIVVLGTCIEALILATVVGCAIAAFAFVICLWYVAIPLALLFLGILFFRWSHLRNIKSVMKENKRK